MRTEERVSITTDDWYDRDRILFASYFQDYWKN